MDYRKLRGLIITKYGTVTAFAKEVGKDPSQMSKLLTGNAEWTRKFMSKVITALGIPKEEIGDIFFAFEVAI